MIQKLDQLEKRYHEIQQLVADPAVLRDQGRYRELMRESAGLQDVVEAYATFKKLLKDIEGTRQVIQEGGDSELVALAREELKELKEKEEAMSHELKLLLVPKDPLDTKNIIMEIRAGTGGEVRRRPVPHVLTLCRVQALGHRNPVVPSDRDPWIQGDRVVDFREKRV
jgi:peptide chain release factor 1